MPEELESIVAMMSDRQPIITHGSRAFHRGRISGQAVVAAFSRCGKVAAAATATEMIVRFDVGSLVFTGLAGGIGPGVSIGDVVVPETLVQHDLDARPLFPRFEVPLMGRAIFETDASLRSMLRSAAAGFLEDPGEKGPFKPGLRLHGGLIASGDQFIGSDAQRKSILDDIEGVVAVDMEAAAVGQIAHDYEVPFAVVRVVSDTADDHAGEVFDGSLGSLAGLYAQGMFSRVFAL